MSVPHSVGAPTPRRGDAGSPSAHGVRFFDELAYPAREIAGYLSAALTARQGAVVVATPDHLAEIRAALAGLVGDRLGLDDGLVVLDAQRVAAALAVPAQRRDAFEALVAAPVRHIIERRGRVRAYGEVVDSLTRTGDHDGALQLEALWEALLAGAPLELLCGYGLGAFASAAGGARFRRVCEAHGHVDDSPAADVPVDGDDRRVAGSTGRLRAEARQATLALEAETARARARGALFAEASRRITAARLSVDGIVDAVASELTRDLATACAVHLVPAPDGSGPLRLVARWPRAGAASVHPAAPADPADPADPITALATEIAAAVAARRPVECAGHVIVPLVVAGRVVGVLTAVRGAAPGFDELDRRLVIDLAERVAVSVDNARLYEQACRERERAEQERERAEQERERAERERERAERERTRAERANRSKDEFLAMLGHELRNPLSPILTAVQLMQLRHGDALGDERVVIERHLGRMVRLVDDLLDISRITRGKVELVRARVDLVTVVGHAVEAARPLFDERLHQLVVAVPGDLVLDADADRLGQVLGNLLTNAARYTPPRGHIEVTARRHGDTVALSVVDDGIGIAPSLLPGLFEPFVQGDQRIAEGAAAAPLHAHEPGRGPGGLGLGLAIARSLVELHGGRLGGFSAGPGRGSEFVIELPLAGRDAATAPAKAGLPIASVPRRVLIVDDNTDAADLLCSALRHRGHRAVAAYDGPSALDLAVEFRPEIALLDIGLPGMDGYELGQRLRALFGDGLALIALTGYGQEGDRRRALDAGFAEHLVKPVDLRTVLEALERARPGLASPG